jgi:hypothetical protein
VQRAGVNWKRWAAALAVFGLAAAMLLSAGRVSGAHGRWWRTVSAFVEAFGGLLGIALIGVCVLAFLLVADALLPKDEAESDRP